MADICSEAIALYDRYTHEGLDRRTLMAELTRIAGSAAAASALLMAIAADPAAAATTDEKDPRLIIRRGPIGLKRGKLDGYVVAPQLGGQAKKIPAVLLVHENRGLNRHIEDVARRLALAGFCVVAPDFLTGFGGTRGFIRPGAFDRLRQLTEIADDGRIFHFHLIGRGIHGRIQYAGHGLQCILDFHHTFSAIQTAYL